MTSSGSLAGSQLPPPEPVPPRERVRTDQGGGMSQQSITDQATTGEVESQNQIGAGDATNTPSENNETSPDAIRRKLEGTAELVSLVEQMMEQGRSLYNQFGQTGAINAINGAIHFESNAIYLAPDSYTHKPMMFSDLGLAYRVRFESMGSPGDLEKAIKCTEQALALAPEGYVETPKILSNLGICFHTQFQFVGDLVSIDAAIDYQGRAVSLISDGDAIKPGMLSGLGVMYLTRFESLGEESDINKAIEYQSRAVELTAGDDEEKIDWLLNLETSYRTRFEAQGEVTNLDKAIDYASQAAILVPDGHPSKPNILNNLAVSHQARFMHLGSLSDVTNAIDYKARAISLIPDGHTDKPRLLNSLGVSYRSRFEHSGDLEDIDKSIGYSSQAVALVSNDKDKSNFLNSLGVAYQSRFESLGELADIDNAIDNTTQAVAFCPEGHALKPMILMNLGNSYQSRFERLAELADVDRAIDLKSQAVLLTPDDDTTKPIMLGNLGISYVYRFRRSHEPTDANKAIEYLNDGVLLLSDTHMHLARMLNNLADAYRIRFGSYKDLEDINRAVSSNSRALALLAEGHADRPKTLYKLAGSYYDRFWLHSELEDLNNAITFINQAVAITPDGHAVKPAMLLDLGKYYHDRFEHQGEPTDIEIAVSYLQRAAQSTTGPPSIRLVASRRWARLSSSNDISSPLLAYQTAMELVPQLVWVGTTIDQRYRMISDMGDLAAEAASCAISFEAYDLAVEWLEAGRSIVWNQILQLRTPFDNLAAANPELTNRLKEVSRELELAGSQSSVMSKSFSTNNTMSGLHWDAQQHHRLASEWNDLLQRARDIPGFQNFMRSRKAIELTRAALDGSIALVNVHSNRCDALVIRPNCEEITHVPLDNFSLEKATGARVDLISLIGHRGGRAGGFKRAKPVTQPEETFKAMLSALWRDAVKPIFDFLGYKHRLPIDELPHITWCTTGPLSFLPLHAAGCYNQQDPNAADLAISSYTPTLSALLAPKSHITGPNMGILAVGQEHTKGMGDLPNTLTELAAISEYAKTTRFLQLNGQNATINAVLSAMNEYNWVHLACHATQVIGDPGQSAFHLWDGNLTLATITKQSFNNKGLAFLSACQTATGDEELPDEVVHLAAGMLMAGYPSVIATMWSIHDEDAPEVAECVYADLLKDGRMDHSKAAIALHKAMAKLRENVGESLFERWVPFVHIGI